jgi:transposase
MGRSYTPQYRADAVKLAGEIGSGEAARQLKIPADTLYTWVSRAKSGDLPMSPVAPDPKNSLNLAARVKELETEVKMLRGENAQIRREHQILEDAAVFFAARQKKLGKN